MKILKKEEYKNKAVVARKENNLYIVTASLNGKIVGTFETEYIEEAQEVFANSCNEMYK